MQTSSTPQPAAESDSVSLQTNLLALTLAIELARAGDAGRGAGLPAMAVRQLHELLGDEAHQIGGGAGLRCAVEELERVLRQAGQATRRRRPTRAAGSRAKGARGRRMRTEGIGER